MPHEQELETFEKVVQGTLSSDNNIRTHAEVLFERSRSQPNTFLRYLIVLMRQSHHLDVREFCAVMLRQTIMKKKEMWNKCSLQTQQFVIKNLLDDLQQDQSPQIHKKLCNVIGELGAHGHWPELVPILLNMCDSSELKYIQSALSIFEVLAEYSVDGLRPHFSKIKNLLCKGLIDPENPSIQLSALKTIVSLLIEMEDSERNHMTNTIPLIFGTVNMAFEKGDNECVQNFAEILIDLALCQTMFLRPHLKNIISLMVRAASEKEVADISRGTCMEFLLTLAENGKGMIRKFNEFSQSVIPLAFQFMLEIDETKTWNPDNDEQHNFEIGLDAIDRLAISLGGNIFLTVANPIIQQFIISPNWINRHAALMSINQMAEGCRKQLDDQMQDIVGLIVPFIGKADEDPRVRWAAIHSITEIAVQFAPYFQEQFHSLILPGLISIMNLDNSSILIRHAICCVVDFSDEMDPGTLGPYVDSLMKCFLKLLNVKNTKIQESALTAVASIAGVIGEDFINYYNVCVLWIKNILQTANSKEFRELRGIAMEAIGIIAKAVGKEKFGPDAPQFMRMLISDQRSGFASDDPQYACLIQAQARICECLKEDFVPYLDAVIPPLFKSASRENVASIEDVDEKNAVEELEGYETVTVSIRSVGSKKLTLNTSFLEEKILACNLLYQYATVLKEYFFPYVDQCSRILVPLLSYQFNETIRVSSVAALPALVESVSVFLKKKGHNQQPVGQLFNFMFSPYCHAIAEEFKMDSLQNILDSFSNSMLVMYSADLVMSKEQIETVNGLLEEIIGASNLRREEREQKRHSDDCDEEESFLLDEENEAEDELLTYVHSCIAAMVKINKDGYMPSFISKLFKFFWPLILDPTKSSIGQIQAGLCVIDDIIQYGGHTAKQYVKEFYPIVTKYCLHSEVDVRHAAVFGIGSCAIATGLEFKPVRNEALDVLLQVIMDSESRNEDNAPATDNAISSVGKIFRHCYEEEPILFKGTNFITLWLAWLPITTDEEEADVVHQNLLYLLKTRSSSVLGENNEYLPKVLSILSEVLTHRRGLTDETKMDIISFIKQLATSLAKNQFRCLLQTEPITNEQRIKIMEILT